MGNITVDGAKVHVTISNKRNVINSNGQEIQKSNETSFIDKVNNLASLAHKKIAATLKVIGDMFGGSTNEEEKKELANALSTVEIENSGLKQVTNSSSGNSKDSATITEANRSTAKEKLKGIALLSNQKTFAEKMTGETMIYGAGTKWDASDDDEKLIFVSRQIAYYRASLTKVELSGLLKDVSQSKTPHNTLSGKFKDWLITNSANEAQALEMEIIFLNKYDLICNKSRNLICELKGAKIDETPSKNRLFGKPETTSIAVVFENTSDALEKSWFPYKLPDVTTAFKTIIERINNLLGRVNTTKTSNAIITKTVSKTPNADAVFSAVEDISKNDVLRGVSKIIKMFDSGDGSIPKLEIPVILVDLQKMVVAPTANMNEVIGYFIECCKSKVKSLNESIPFSETIKDLKEAQKSLEKILSDIHNPGANNISNQSNEQTESITKIEQIKNIAKEIDEKFNYSGIFLSNIQNKVADLESFLGEYLHSEGQNVYFSKMYDLIKTLSESIEILDKQRDNLIYREIELFIKNAKQSIQIFNQLSGYTIKPGGQCVKLSKDGANKQPNLLEVFK